jgi:N-acylneuraminate cytidylyltransferase
VRTIALVPARGGSKRLPRKNVRRFAGHPLLAYSIAAARATPAIDGCFVSTDDGETAAIAREYGAAVIDRPEMLAGDLASSASVVVHALETLRATGQRPDVVVLLQPTAPLRPPRLIADALDLLAEGGCDSVISVTAHHHKTGTIAGGLFVPEYQPGTRSQDLPQRYFENGLVYASWSRMVLSEHSVFGTRIRPLDVEPLYALADVDTALDFALAEWLFTSHAAEFEWLRTAVAAARGMPQPAGPLHAT